MTCGEFEEVINDLDRAGTPEGALREKVLAHAESCGTCARLLTETESLDFGLQALAAQDADRHAPSHVEVALLQAFRREKQASVRPRMWWQVAALATAAVVLLALGFSLRDHWVTSRNSPIKNAALTQASVRAGQSGPDAIAPLSADAAAPEYEAGFVALPYADDSASMEGAAVVRVALSASALASLGVPVADATDTNQIPADLIVSADGTPQAIRLVPQVTAN